MKTTDGRLIQAFNQPMPGGGLGDDARGRHRAARAEDQVREQKLQMDAALDNISQGLLMFGADGRLILCNRRYLELYGLSPDIVKPGLTASGAFASCEKRTAPFGRSGELCGRV